MDASSLGLTCAGLVVLVHEIMDLYRHIEIAKKLHKDANYFLTALLLQQMGFSAWAECMGATFSADGQMPLFLKVELKNEAGAAVWAACCDIQRLLEEARETAQKYVIEKEVPAADQEPIDESKVLNKQQQAAISAMRLVTKKRVEIGRLGSAKTRFKWTLVGRDDARELLRQLDQLLEGLYRKLPSVQIELQRKLAEDRLEFKDIANEQLQTLVKVSLENGRVLTQLLEQHIRAQAQPTASSSSSAHANYGNTITENTGSGGWQFMDNHGGMVGNIGTNLPPFPPPSK